jgi:biopolymer transport protein ExbD
MKKPPPPTSLTLNLAPMVDVMMCLLIFFMLATKMVEQEHTRIDLPVATSAKDAKRETASGRFVINIRRTAAAGQDEVVYLLREEALPLDQLLERLSAAGRLDPQLTCLIRADRHVRYRDVEAILAGCARTGVSNVSLGAIRNESTGAT